MTLGALRAIRAAGLRVPADIALVAVDDPAWAALVDPPLTTLAQPVRRMATDAMELLLQRVTGERDRPRRIVHPFELRRRDSTGGLGRATSPGGALIERKERRSGAGASARCRAPRRSGRR